MAVRQYAQKLLVYLKQHVCRPVDPELHFKRSVLNYRIILRFEKLLILFLYAFNPVLLTVCKH